MYFDWKILLEKVQLTRDLQDDTIFYQKFGLLFKKNATPPNAHSQSLFGFLKTHSPYSKLLNSCQN